MQPDVLHVLLEKHAVIVHSYHSSRERNGTSQKLFIVQLDPHADPYSRYVFPIFKVSS